MTLQEQIRSNQLRTFVVVLGFAALLTALAAAVWVGYSPGVGGVIGIIGIVYGIVSYVSAGKMVASAAGARPVSRQEAPELYRAVENAAIGAGVARTPDVYIIPDAAPNAFAAGRSPDTAYVAATTGLLNMLDKRELEGVMAHEMAHVRNRDVELMTIATVLVGVVMLVCDLLMRVSFWGGGDDDDSPLGAFGMVIGLVAVLLAPLFAFALQMALSRRREYLADVTAVEITGDPDGLASALQKLADDPTPLRKVTRATAHLYIESPLRDHKGLRSGLGGMFDTHPPLEDRIARLRELGATVAPPPAVPT